MDAKKKLSEKYKWNDNKREDKGKDTKKKNDAKKSNVCPYAKKCGSCHFQGVSYEEQLAKKQKELKQLLGGFGKVSKIIGMENPYHYRNKVHAVFGRLRNGTIVSGVYQAGTHKIVDIESCQIEDEISSKIIRDIHGLLRSFKIKTYDEDTGYGLLRHVLIRRGFTSGQVMVVLVLGSPCLLYTSRTSRYLCLHSGMIRCISR